MVVHLGQLLCMASAILQTVFSCPPLMQGSFVPMRLPPD